MCWEKWLSTLQKNVITPSPHTTYKNTLKTNLDLDIKPETLKLVEENEGEKLHNIGLGNDFFYIPKHTQQKQK
jgi:hypothetical protein